MKLNLKQLINGLFIFFIVLVAENVYATKPTISAVSANSISMTTATLNGTVNSSNSNTTTISFNYGLSSTYGTTVTASPSSLASGTTSSVSANISGLSCGTTYHFRVTATNGNGLTNGSDTTFITSACPPAVTSINTASNNPTSANTVVSWTVVFSTSVTGVDISDFALIQAGGTTGASITSVTGGGTTYTVTANTGTGILGTLKLNLIDDDSIQSSASPITALGGTGINNGNFGGQSYTLIVPVCNSSNSSVLFCDDFERSVSLGGSNTAGAVGSAPNYGAWTVSWANQSNCNGVTGNLGCAGIDSDVPPWNDPTKPRANSTRSVFTRWSNVVVTSPVINLSTLPAQSKTAQITFWLRRGSDCFSEWPGNNQAGCGATIGNTPSTSGEEFRVEYLNNAGAWIALAQYPTEAPPGEIMNPVIDLPDDALHANFQMRFVQPSGSGSNGTNGGAAGVIGYDYWHFDNVIVTEQPATKYAGAFCDTFEGDLSRWTMTGIGNANIGSTYKQNGVHDMDLRWNTVSATTKTTDMTNTAGEITFWVKRGIGSMSGYSYPNITGSDAPDSGHDLKVEYFNNAGNWVTATSFLGSGTPGQVYPTASTATAIGSANATRITLPADAKHSKFKLRFTFTSGSGVYDTDYWHVDDVCVGAVMQTTDLSLSQTSSGSFSPGQYVTYNFTVANAGPNIEPGAVSIIDTLPAGLTYQGTSAGWACSATGQVVTCTRAGSLGVGASAALTLTASVDSTIQSGTITNTATVGGQSIDSNLLNNSASKSDAVIVPRFVFTDKPCFIGIPIGSGSQCNMVNWSPQIAGKTLNNIYITAVQSGIPTALNAGSATAVSMQFALSCHNPIQDAGVAASFSAIGTLPLCAQNGAIPSNWSAATALNFPANTPSVGAYDFNYADVGAVELFMRNSAVTTQIGTSATFVVKPYNLALTNIMATNNGAGRCTVVPNSTPVCATTASDNVLFAKAGEAFSATVSAITYSGTIAPNFGKEQVPETVRFVDTSFVSSDSNYANHGSLVAPTAGSNPAINGSFPSFNNGSATGTAFSWNEVGILQLTAAIGDGDYLGAGDIIGTTTSNIGRFYPDHFALTAGTTTPSCNTFTYFGEDGFTTAFTLTAQSLSNTTTTNYTGSFAKLGLNSWNSFAFTTATALPSGSILTASTTVPTGSWVNGVANVSAKHQISRPATLTGETSVIINARPVDSDGVTISAATAVATATPIRYGRISLQNAYGSELLDLAMPMTAQYWNGTSWVKNSSDSCSTSVLSLSDPNSNDGLIPSELTRKQYQSPPILGDFALIWHATGTGNTGSLDVTASVPDYLKFNWRGTGNINPTAKATFGIYKGNQKVIYSRELY